MIQFRNTMKTTYTIKLKNSYKAKMFRFGIEATLTGKKKDTFYSESFMKMIKDLENMKTKNNN